MSLPADSLRPEPRHHGEASRCAIVFVAACLLGILVWRANHVPRVKPHAPRDPAFLVDVNRADADTLQLLPGLGPSIAANVVKRRDTAGPFRRVEELEDVRMIGPVLRKRMTPWVTLGQPITTDRLDPAEDAGPPSRPTSSTPVGGDAGPR